MREHKGFFVVLVFLFALFLSAAEGYSYTIDASAGAGGTITPSGMVTVAENDNQTFDITPYPDYIILDVVVDSVSEGPDPSHTFFNVTADHSIIASFTCADPIMLWDGTFDTFKGYYDTIMAAYNDASSDDIIMLQDGIFFAFTELLTFDRDITVVLDGGYDCSFTDNSMVTKIAGSLTISAGTVITSNIIIDGGTPPCVEGDPDNYPGNVETCDGLDNNCNGIADDGLGTDADGDGHYTTDSCFTFTPADDCDDNDPNNFPGNPEVCDGLDNNCDSVADDGLVPTDADGDGFTSLDSCGGSADDCDDNDAGIYPGAVEILGDGIDQDCNGKDVSTSEEVCFGCHTNITWIDFVHTRVQIPSPSCQDCHSERDVSVRSHYDQTVVTPGNNMTADSVIECRSCHDWHNEEFYTIPGDYIVWAKVHNDPIGRPNLTCYTCHETLDTDHESATAHNNRVIDPLCANCHTSDTSVLGSPGTGTLETDADINALHTFAGEECLHCHAYTGTAPDAAIVEQAIQDGFAGSLIDCLYCHGVEFPTVHSFIQDHGLLIRVGGTSCGNCHSDPPPLINPADPKVHSDCTNCHNPDYTTKSLAAGKTFAAGGDCVTCHGDHFPNHSHHNGAYNDVSYDDGVDTSQAAQLGCALCHHDYDNVNTTSLGLSTWETILVEHDLDGIKDGSTNTCDNCHAYDGSKSAPQVAVQDAIASGNPATCATCHTDKVPDVDHGSPHPANDFSWDGNCSLCHTGANVVADVHNGTCTTCHSSVSATRDNEKLGDASNGVDGDARKADGTAAGSSWSSVTCTTCHGVDTTTTNSDGHHVASSSNYAPTGNCTPCHDGTGSGIRLADHAVMVATYVNCSTCHTATGSTIDPADDMVHDGCTDCHNNDTSLIDPATSTLVSAMPAGPAGTNNGGGSCDACHGEYFDNHTHHGTASNDVSYNAATDTSQSSQTGCAVCHDDTGNAQAAWNDTYVEHKSDCANCHSYDGSKSAPLADVQNAISSGNPATCATCHTDKVPDVDHGGHGPDDFGWSPSCSASACHNEAGNSDIVASPDVHNNECGLCHENPNGGGTLRSYAVGKTISESTTCITCHGNDLNTLHPSSGASHIATPGSDYVLLWFAGEHDSAMIGDGEVFMDCTTCHSANLGNVHGNNCATCHLSPADTVIGTWTGGCQEGGCHTTRHEDKRIAHYSVEDQCTLCHGASSQDFPPLPSSCANCHATYDPNDTVPPVTTSDAQASYVIPALITFMITDNGGKVGLGTTYYRIDGGAEQTGTSAFTAGFGSHSLEFWSVDQAGNVESPTNIVNFTILTDTMPPVTTSNIQPNYETNANITLTAIDDNGAGITTTYYSLDSGPTETGTSILVPELDGTFSYTLDFWSVDWTGNVEPTNTESFTIYGGTVTLRLVWGSSDTTGSPCPGDPEATANWTIRRVNAFGPIVATGAGACPGWSGVDDVVVDVSLTPLHVSIDWWDSNYGWYDNTIYTDIDVSSHGDVLRLGY